MSRGFTEQEKKDLKERLVKVFVTELNTKSFSAISVEDLANQVGIAKGSFYHFFKSKDELFAAVFNQLQDDMINESMKIAQEDQRSPKDRLKNLIMYLVRTISEYPWLKHLSNVEYERVFSRLGSEAKEQLQQKDLTDLSEILKILKLKSVYSAENITIINQIILSSALNKNDYGKNYDDSVQIMINLLVDSIFIEQEETTS
ncbi:TetR/AcrR family transcriptional regulator [Xylocopilactobacillus apis]|uniref:TetR family transcriptional regulator n=1 Tax=Xylocopilactobacillus apis TaxID=2932183 RepID=A0AAU9DTI2_9LACO|nr:TetR/AcrR family transcriptional regulator [Xylocopilactobacillus apis]BDR57078.1 TetR family transcriptional regulator [Xylocopilactobacillus apis]